MMKRKLLAITATALLAGLVSSCALAQAQPGLFRARLLSMQQPSVPAGTRVIGNVGYGDDPRQRLDVYAPAQATNAPVIFMVHGGAWAFGTKTARGVVENKVARWVPKGFIVISIGYRMLPDTAPLAQADDVARALAFAQRHAREWGGDPAQFIVMGHSAGAHLVSLITADTAIARQRGVQPWLGTVSLDSAALDVVDIMQQRHLPLYDRAFGSDEAGWMAVSPMQQLHDRIVPFLAVCSTRRQDSCPQAQRFVAKAASFGSSARMLPEDLTHEQINEQLGTASAYTDNVEAFMRSLSPVVANALSQH
jgi:acetyl esterase/lipase